MLEIAGGTYLEYCSEPQWSQLYGSGLRAAAALSRLSKEIVLHTYISKQDKRSLEVTANTFGFDVLSKGILRTVSFSYRHGLSEPEIDRGIGPTDKLEPHRIEAKNILRFGFMEQEAIVNGERVVYDPQSIQSPKEFRGNGSTAKHLAIVANLHEGSKLTGETDAVKIARTLISKQNAEVVIIKRGPFGAMVFTKRGVVSSIPPFKTDFVWPIGSGDVFAAVFAHYWTEKEINPVKASYLASQATAIYCNSQSLPIPSNFSSNFRFEPLNIGKKKLGKQTLGKKVYLAGPFFTMAQRWLMNEARIYLESLGFQVFSPFHDVGIGAAVDVVPLDIKAINKSDIVFTIAEGLDAGTMFEIGYARAKGIPVVIFVQNEKEENLKMPQGTKCLITDDFVTGIYKTFWFAVES